MFEQTGKIIEIKPMTTGNRETLIIDTEERKIASIHIHDVREGRYVKMYNQICKMYGYNPVCMILEIITTPNKSKSYSMKTISHELLYYNINDLNSDFEKLKQILISQ